MPIAPAITRPMLRKKISERKTKNCINGSQVDHAPIGVEHALMHHFREGWVRKYCIDEFGFGGLAVHGDNKALDELRHLGSNHMGPEKFARFGVENGFDEALGLPERDRLAVADKRKTSDPDVEP